MTKKEKIILSIILITGMSAILASIIWACYLYRPTALESCSDAYNTAKQLKLNINGCYCHGGSIHNLCVLNIDGKSEKWWCNRNRTCMKADNN